MKDKKLGLIVNPIAGMGGKVGLKGTDGEEILRKAKVMGAQSESPKRAVEALKRMWRIRNSVKLITYPHEMGEYEAKECGLSPNVIGSITSGKTTSRDTENAANELLELGVDLLLFAGGDGTARDICNAVGDKVAVLGIPAGVKIHSAVYATNSRNAGDLADMYLSGESGIRLRKAEVMDIDEDAFRNNRVAARLYGYLNVPYRAGLVQSGKSGTNSSEEAMIDAIACDVVNNMDDECIYIISSGTTTQAIKGKLGLKGTLLGIDAVYRGELIGSDLNEAQLLSLIEGKKAKIVATIIGGQGYIFGRGNQQISTRVIKKVGKDNIMVVATGRKILSLRGNPLLVDTGDEEVDKMLAGHIQVITGLNERTVAEISP
ncbi:hypothetical protein ES708_09621 [subsurface metagenome]